MQGDYHLFFVFDIRKICAEKYIEGFNMVQ